MKYPIYRKNNADFKTFYMILSEGSAIAVDKDSLEISNYGSESINDLLNKRFYSDATPSEFELAYKHVTNSLNYIITTTNTIAA
jgi:hypothetical protein